ncbi:alkaline phosphatase D family protein [Allostreptomyces psammosilenae]|nr:alkaline phosphatase D family protein [Allostreptomyces psammosilenae]
MPPPPPGALGGAPAPAPATTALAPAFLHGVASGDPLPDGVLLWTRVTPHPGAGPGSGLGGEVEVSWEVAAAPDFSSVLVSGSTVTGPARDHTVKADVRGLSPATDYWYRFRCGQVVSAAGRTRTAPAHDAEVTRMRFGVVSCANWEAGYFSAYRHLAARGDLDAVLHLGDYLYEYGTGEYAARGRVVRVHEPAHEIVTLADYRARHAQYKTDPDLRALHAALPIVAIWDDHEFADNAWAGGAVNHQPDTEGDWTDRVAAAQQAYFEWMPVRQSDAGEVYRRLRFGRLVDLSLLDLRSYRSAPGDQGGRAGVDDPHRTLTGRAQMEWLKSGLAESDAAWHLVGNSVMISPVAFLKLPAYLLRPLAELLGLPKEGLAVNTDQWDGYTADRRELLEHLRRNRIGNTVFLTGDIHSAWASDVPGEAATYSTSGSLATEFVVTSVTSDNIDDMLKVPPRTVSSLAARIIRTANPHVKWVDLDSHGFGVLDVRAERAQMDYYALDDRTRPDSGAQWLRSYAVDTGSQRVRRADAPVR